MHTPLTHTQIIEAAQRLAAEFNHKHGGEFLTATQHIDNTVTVGELRKLAERLPGPYLAASAYLQIKGRIPTRGETIALGRLLAALGILRKKDGASTLWLLDASAAQRLS